MLNMQVMRFTIRGWAVTGWATSLAACQNSRLVLLTTSSGEEVWYRLPRSTYGIIYADQDVMSLLLNTGSLISHRLQAHLAA